MFRQELCNDRPGRTHYRIATLVLAGCNQFLAIWQHNLELTRGLTQRGCLSELIERGRNQLCTLPRQSRARFPVRREKCRSETKDLTSLDCSTQLVCVVQGLALTRKTIIAYCCVAMFDPRPRPGAVISSVFMGLPMHSRLHRCDLKQGIAGNLDHGTVPSLLRMRSLIPIARIFSKFASARTKIENSMAPVPWNPYDRYPGTTPDWERSRNPRPAKIRFPFTETGEFLVLTKLGQGRSGHGSAGEVCTRSIWLQPCLRSRIRQTSPTRGTPIWHKTWNMKADRCNVTCNTEYSLVTASCRSNNLSSLIYCYIKQQTSFWLVHHGYICRHKIPAWRTVDLPKSTPTLISPPVKL